MTIAEEKLANIVKELSITFVGGEAYFHMLDARLRSWDNIPIIQELFDNETIKNTVVLTGGFGYHVRMLRLFGYLLGIRSLIHISGGLRRQGKPKLIYYEHNYETYVSTKHNLIFVDDSYYSGKTFNVVRSFLYDKGGYQLNKVRVAYDGSRVKQNYISSLYRYYDHLPELARHLLLH